MAIGVYLLTTLSKVKIESYTLQRGLLVFLINPFITYPFSVYKSHNSFLERFINIFCKNPKNDKSYYKGFMTFIDAKRIFESQKDI
jgi:hypothetical protein